MGRESSSPKARTDREKEIRGKPRRIPMFKCSKGEGAMHIPKQKAQEIS